MKLQSTLGIPDKSLELHGELRATGGDWPEDDLDVVINKRIVLVMSLHPRCGIDRDDAESRAEYLQADP
jgi:hypothetical protein